ncbi:MAG: nickel-dependent hydrogenase large subunit [Aquificaceae bacterium]|uniref:nickel-dependent hydrogenase large subunit n=1 Tax=Hydrogenobacter sp. Uz 6-8 TaxID=3384828 RepID=UPI00309AF4AB
MRLENLELPRVEGEARLELLWKDGVVEDARVCITSIRGVEKVLMGRHYMDALVITPRVCGICGHAHLMASVTAIEKALGVEPAQKGQLVRRITQSLEILQNHIKWFYLFLMPDFVLLEKSVREFYEPFRGRRWQDAIKVASKIAKGIALFSGQWPHSSYAVPGGITSEPSAKEVTTLRQILSELRDFFLKYTVGMEEGEFISCLREGSWRRLGGDAGLFLELSHREGLLEAGRSYDRFISGGSLYFPCGYFMKRVVHGKLRVEQLQELESSSYSGAKPVRYRGMPFETGPLSRQLIAGNPITKSMHRELRDSFAVRVMARVLEVWSLTEAIEEWTQRLKEVLHERSTSLGRFPSKFSGRGYGVVEAARGTLIHSVSVKEGTVQEYSIITPSQWNLGPRCENFLGVAERAILGLKSPLHAQMVLRSFDLCSVCTTH